MKIHEFLKNFLRKAAAAAPLPRLYYKICYRGSAAVDISVSDTFRYSKKDENNGL
jgi:hypothetical protein